MTLRIFVGYFSSSADRPYSQLHRTVSQTLEESAVSASSVWSHCCSFPGSRSRLQCFQYYEVAWSHCSLYRRCRMSSLHTEWYPLPLYHESLLVICERKLESEYRDHTKYEPWLLLFAFWTKPIQKCLDISQLSYNQRHRHSQFPLEIVEIVTIDEL